MSIHPSSSVLCVGIALVMSVFTAVPVTATESGRVQTVTLHPPVVQGDSAVLSGRATGARTVTLERRAGQRWVKVAKARVRKGRFQTSVELRSSRQVIRARVGRAASRSRTLAARTPVDACGPQPAKSRNTFWSCTFVDDFNGADLDRTKWLPQEIYAEGNLDKNYACYRDDPSVVSVSGGALHLSLRVSPVALACLGSTLEPTVFVAGSVSTYHLFSQQYGRFEARVRNTATTEPGLHEAFWLWPDDRVPSTVPWPEAGEIDVAETYSSWPKYAAPYLHYTANDNGGPIQGLNTNVYCPAQRGEWNTYAVEWSPTRIEILINGKSCLVNTSGDPAFKKKYIVAVTQGMGTDSNSYVGTAPLPATTDVDYVRVWK